MLTVVGVLVEMYSNDMATFQVEKEQKFVPYVWTVTVSCASWMKNDSTTVLNVFSFPYSSSVGLFFFVVFRGGTTNTSRGIPKSSAGSIMCPFPLAFCGSRISLSRRCKCRSVLWVRPPPPTQNVSLQGREGQSPAESVRHHQRRRPGGGHERPSAVQHVSHEHLQVPL